MKLHYDYLIVGQGLAGNMMAYRLTEAGFSCLIVDETSGATASRQATGLINPITGRRFVKSWLTDELIAESIKTYGELGEKFGQNFFRHTTITKIIASVEQLNDLAAKQNDPEYAAFLGKGIEKYDDALLLNPYGTISIENVLQVAIEKLLDSFKNYWQNLEILVNEKFDFDEFKVADDGFRYKDFSFSKVIFCEGFQAYENPFFNYLPLRHTKGEALVIKCPGLNIDNIVGGTCNITPMGDNVYYAGASYDWNDKTLNPTKARRDDLTEKIKETLALPFEIIQHKAGVRPTVIDRRPLLGEHPKYKNMYIFNGFGTKGLSLAPYFSLQFIDFLKGKEKIHPEADIKRFEQKHYV